MSQRVSELTSPAVLIEADALERNIRRMQAICDENGVELWPHIKTHKLVPVLRRQLEVGAKGATCAKIGEAEAMLPSGVKRIFIAHSLADLSKAPRLKALSEKLDQLVLAVTSEVHFEMLERILEAADIRVPIMMAVDTGLNREGARNHESAVRLAEKIRQSPRMELFGIYTHEGFAYGSATNEDIRALVPTIAEKLRGYAEAVGGGVLLWPGCSATASYMAAEKGISAVRPGAYVLGDLSLTESGSVMPYEDAAITVLTTVLDHPCEGLALVDVGSKVLSSDKSLTGIHARGQDLRKLTLNRLNEEHGYLFGEGVDDLPLGTRIRVQPAHVCPVMNLASQVYLVRGEEVLATWPVEGRGRSD